jgi:DTW domain-containing protein YfiP
MCLCDVVPRLAARTRVHVLQHPRERRHPLGTVRLLRLALPELREHVLELDRSRATPVDLPAGAGLLYPSEDARPLEPGALQDLVVLDGTWSQAKMLYRDNAWLRALPHYALSPTEGSRYRIRPEPRAECLSTMEAVVSALRLLEPDLQGTDGVLGSLDVMIDRQIAAHGRGDHHAPKRSRGRGPRLPDGVADGTVVYAEADPLDGARPIRVTAWWDGRVLDRWVRPPVLPDAWTCAQLGVARATLASAPSLNAALDELAGFGSGAWLSASRWTDRFLAAWQPGRARLWLKPVWTNLGAPPPLSRTLDVPGRAGARLALAVGRRDALVEACG